MRGLDTNVLVRYLAADDEKQLATVEQLLDDSQRNREPLLLTAIALCELVWVLTTRYDQSKSEIIRAVEVLLSMDYLTIEYETVVRRSVESFRNGKGSFSDYLIAGICTQHGCRDFVTFDRALKHSARITVLA
ncbi:MAG TPA: type II toxin-antitoxin system VapC family toxin [Bryobacteraceae bacterium]|nr:type II toxin-antitoxin system VapC family toxin [Bryobacteraceae bacterium]